ncbi:uncharacterized protein LOC123897629 [Trifolium pratense]|uniref:uncharacterized protein LOC123897629 n=1 Tax=Trifolium pratense TaxID=57577 RepID=UPI001E6960B7|nr:uncharacterized protein LOC123897629 [Trifolium pratense]
MPNTRSRGEIIEQPFDEPERLLNERRRNLSTQPENIETEILTLEVTEEIINEIVDEPVMAENRPLRSYAIPSQEEPHNSIAAPAIEANNFELKPSLLAIVQQNQFSGNPADDPNLHLSIFLQYADTIKANGVSPEAIRLRLFPFSLRDKARAWLQSLPSNSVATWDELKKVFLARYFPPSKTAMLRAQINGFRQRDNESLFEAWERYKEMIRICPHHGLENWLIIHTFYNGLLYNTRMTIDAAAGGALMDKPYNQAYQLIESMAQNHYQWGNERTTVEKPQTKGGMYEISNMDHINAKLDALTQKIESLTNAPKATMAATIQNCELCGAQGHAIAECRLLTEAPTDQVNYTQGNSYNQNQRNHPYLSYNSNNALYAPGQAPTPSPPGFQKPAQNAPMKSNLELMIENFIAIQTQTNKEVLNQNIHTNEQIKQLTSRLDVLTTHTRMLETQIAQVAQKQASTAAPAGIFPGQPEPNPRGHVNAIILRSGNRYEGPADPRTNTPTIHQDSDEVTKGESEQNIKDKENSGEEIIEKKKPYIPPPPYQPPIPYPQRFEKSKSEGQFRKFVELLKKLNITIPFTEAITQMPSYAKFLKEILTKKKKIEDEEIVMLTAECSAILQNDMPHKLKDPGSFSIPCVIGNYVIDRALCDLGASISLMPMSICEKLNLGELRPTKMSIQFADRSVKYPLGILENVPVRVGQFYIPTDFIVMDIREDSNTPIILGRPFLATAGAVIDVKEGKLTFVVGEEKAEFILTQLMKAPAIDDSCYMVDVIQECRKESEKDQTKHSEILKTSTPPTHKNGDDDLAKCLEITQVPKPSHVKPTLKLKTPSRLQKGTPVAPNKLKGPVSKKIPPDILKDHPENNIAQNKIPPGVSKKKKEKKKRRPMKWSDIFKWRPKNIEHNLKDVSLEEEPC